MQRQSWYQRVIRKFIFAKITDLLTFASNVASDQQNNIPDFYCKYAMLPQSNKYSNVN